MTSKGELISFIGGKKSENGVSFDTRSKVQKVNAELRLEVYEENI